MRNRNIGLVVVAAALGVWMGPFIAQTQAQDSDLSSIAAAARKLAEEKTPIPRLSNGKPDLTGNWTPTGIASTYMWEEHLGGFGVASAGPSIIVDPPDGKLPYQPWALVERERRRRPESAYEDNSIKCILLGMPRNMVYRLTITQTPDRVVILHQAHSLTTRIIRFNQPPLPSSIRLWMGDPRGRWDGDSLVVESTNFNGQGWGNLGGDLLSDALHIVERFRLANAKTMWWEATITDPKVYTRPWTMRFPGPHVKDGTLPEDEFDFEDSCHAGNADLKHIKNQHDAVYGTKATSR